MTLKSINYFITSALLITASSCLPEPLEVHDIPKLQPHIVVSTQIVPDQSIVVFLTKSIGALEAGKESDPQSLISQIVVDDAIVTIAWQNEVDTLRNLGSGLYGSVSIPIVTNEFYTLDVVSPSMGSVTSVTQAKEAIPFLNVNASLHKGAYDSLAQIEYSLQDPLQPNFYMVNVQRFSRTQEIEDLLNPRLFTHVVTDKEFNGTLFEDDFKVFFQDFSEGDTVAVSLTNISEEYYEYVKVRVDNRFSYASFATEPFNYPTNVTGGYGYFNIQQPDVHVFVLE